MRLATIKLNGAEIAGIVATGGILPIHALTSWRSSPAWSLRSRWYTPPCTAIPSASSASA